MLSGETVALLALGAILVTGIAIALLSRSQAAGEKDHILSNGLLAQAEIIGYHVNDFLWVRYKFLPAGASELVTCEKALTSGAKRLPVGTVVPVRYLAAAPSISLLVPYADHQFPSS